MKGEQCNFIKYMEGPDKRFIIPVYQRNYDWNTDNCKQLYDDLIKIIRKGRKSHFFGSLVSMHTSGTKDEYHVIDGQQRLTTVSLLLLAMYNLLEQEVLVSGDENLKCKIFEEYLVDKYAPKETRIKLKPVKNDNAAFGKLFEEIGEYDRNSNITKNYEYFYERIQKKEITIDELYSAIRKLEIINIRLDADDDPQLIFESLNSTGLDLSEGDKIRNFILMGLPIELQNKYYEKYWNKIELCTNYEISAFIRDYLSVKQQSISPQKKVYIDFKHYVEAGELQPEPLLVNLLAYVKRYEILLKGKKESDALDACIYRLNRLETTVTRPFFLEVLRLLDEGKLSLEEVTEVFRIAENYLFRRSMCNIPTNALNKIFLMLHREIIRYDKTESNYVEKYKYSLLNKRDNAIFPNDVDFCSQFETQEVYKMTPKNKIYILERLENFGTREDKEIYEKCNKGIYSIEHIMPQQLTPAWCAELGSDYEQVHHTWLHRIANLTLTAYNSTYSNRSFKDKKEIPNGFNNSSFRLNTWIAQKNKWTLAELEARSQHLTQRALEIWSLPTTSFQPKEKELESFTLNDYAKISTRRRIAKFRYKNIETPVTSWVEMYINVLSILCAVDKSIIETLASSNKYGIEYNFRFSENPNMISWEPIGNGIVVWTNNNTQDKLYVLEKLFNLYHIDRNDLVFYLRDVSSDGTDSDTLR